jgi:hypothetical protein
VICPLCSWTAVHIHHPPLSAPADEVEQAPVRRPDIPLRAAETLHYDLERFRAFDDALDGYVTYQTDADQRYAIRRIVDEGIALLLTLDYAVTDLSPPAPPPPG